MQVQFQLFSAHPHITGNRPNIPPQNEVGLIRHLASAIARRGSGGVVVEGGVFVDEVEDRKNPCDSGRNIGHYRSVTRRARTVEETRD